MKSKIKDDNTFRIGVSKTIKTLTLVVAVAFSSVLYASTHPKSATANQISAEIGELLKNPYFTVEEDVFAKVKVIFNDNNEIVVLSVDSGQESIDNFIKSRLNYKELTNDVNNKNRYYIVPVRITSEQ